MSAEPEIIKAVEEQEEQEFKTFLDSSKELEELVGVEREEMTPEEAATANEIADAAEALGLGSQDLDKYPVTKDAWEYLTAPREGSALRFFVRRTVLAAAAKAVGRQLTKDEVSVIVREGEVTICEFPDCGQEFREVETLVISNRESNRDDVDAGEKSLIEGLLPKEISDLVLRHFDGSPKVMGSTLLAYGAAGGRVAKSYCGGRFYVRYEGDDQIETVNERSHLGRAIRAAQKAADGVAKEKGLQRHTVMTYTVEGAVRVIAIKRERYAQRKSEREALEEQFSSKRPQSAPHNPKSSTPRGQRRGDDRGNR